MPLIFRTLRSGRLMVFISMEEQVSWFGWGVSLQRLKVNDRSGLYCRGASGALPRYVRCAFAKFWLFICSLAKPNIKQWLGRNHVLAFHMQAIYI